MKTYWQNIEQKREVSISSEPRAAICSEYWGGRTSWRERSASLYWGSGGFDPRGIQRLCGQGSGGLRPPEADDF